MRNKRRIIFAIVGLLLLVSCEERSSELLVENESVNSNQEYVNNEHALNELQPVILGEKLENPFSVENMQLALDSLMSKPNELEEAGVTNRSASCVEIYPTDWYICFKVDSTQFNTLISDTTLSFSQVPLDYEVIQEGDYLEEFQQSDIKTLYTVVKPGYENPDGIDFEIIEELFIPENSEYYAEENADEIESTTENRSVSTKVMNDDFVNALLIQSFVLTGNEKFLPNPEQVKNRSSVYECTTKRFLWWEWTDCNTVYYPEGTIKYETPNGYMPVKGVKVVMWRWFTRIEVTTDKNGYFKSKTKLSHLLATNNVQYYLKMLGTNGSYTWRLDATITGADCWWIDEYNLGSHSPSGYSINIGVNHKAWAKCLVSNAVYDYVTYMRKEGLTLPPNDLRIAVGGNTEWRSCAPLYNKHKNHDFEALASFANILFPFISFSLIKPDIIIVCNNNLSHYYRRVSAVWHELSHASHLQAMINNKGYWWASEYWTTVVTQEGLNEVNRRDTYGKKGDKNWEYIALAEGWACYREWKMSKAYLEYNSISKTHISSGNNAEYSKTPKNFADKIYYRYASLFVELLPYYTDKEIENAISSSNNIKDFNNYLLKSLRTTKYANFIKNRLEYYANTDDL